MSKRATRLAVVALTTVAIVAAPAASVVGSGGSGSVRLACQGTGGGCPAKRA